MDPLLLAYPALGMFAGFVAGMFGVGGGMTMVPLLALLFQYKGYGDDHLMHLALGTCMASVMFTSISSVRAHHRHRAIRWDIVRAMAPGMVVGTLTGSLFAGQVPTRALSIIFVVIVYAAATQMILNLKPKPQRAVPSGPVMAGCGLAIGVVASLVAAGGGFMSVPLMTLWNVPLHHAIGTSAALGFPIAVAGTLGYVWNGLHATNLPAYTLGYVDLQALASVVVFSVLTAPLGARMAHRLPVAPLKRLFGLLLVLLATRMLWGLLA